MIALGGGKGGVGKTFLAANLSALMARFGYRVVAVDTDLEGANLHTWLGVRSPATSLAEFAAGRERDLAKLLVDTSIPQLKLIAATEPQLGAAQPPPELRVTLLQALRRLPCDIAIVDCGAGTHAETIDYFLVGHAGILVVHPEPTSIENAYAFLRASFYRRLQLAMLAHEVRELVQDAMDQRNERGVRTPFDLLREVEAMDLEDGKRFVETMRSFRPQIVMNEVTTAEDVKLGFSIRGVCRRYFGIDAEYLGYVNRDPVVRKSVQARRTVVEAHPHSDAAVYLSRVAGKLAEASGLPRPLRSEAAEPGAEP